MSIARSGFTDHGDSVRAELLSLPAIRTRVEFQFALLSAIGGLVLASGQDTESIALVAVFSAIFGFIFVDWLRVIELPPIGAYLAMGGAAAYCVQDFWALQQQGEPQMVSVALLLVLVQGVLMMQRKSRRILEQLAVFCLLELVVAAIFNDAINFGLLMIPIALIGGSALSLLGLVMLMESIDVTLDPPVVPVPKTRLGRLIRFIAGQAEQRPTNSTVTTASPQSVISIYTAAGPWSRYALFALSPAVCLIAAAFFYVLPRQIPASRSAAFGPAMVGFDDEIRMEQLGQVMQNPKPALKVKLTDAGTDQPYMVRESLYLRGKVLEEYVVDYSSRRPIAKWMSTEPHSMSLQSAVPTVYRPTDASERSRYDDVRVEITCEAMSRAALFSIGPYHDDDDSRDIVHAIDRWTLSRRSASPPFPRIRYRFGTHAFNDGVQTRWIAQASEMERVMSPYEISRNESYRRRSGYLRNRPRRSYTDTLLQFDRSSAPTVSRLAQQILDTIPDRERTAARIAEAMSVYLRTDPAFSYTLNLNATPIPDVDPVEQFLAIDRRGHCQYFAASLALMLRSVGIPSRVVVGYRTEEYNDIGKYYIVRQLHAHSWVEALIDRDQIAPDFHIDGQRRSERYWMQLDPTPAESRLDDGNREGVEGLISFANNIWEDYVVEMDGERQSSDLVKATGLGDVRNSYEGVLGAMQRRLANLRSRPVDGGAMEIEYRLPMMLFAILLVLTALVFAIRQVRLTRRDRQSSTHDPASIRHEPSVRFYAEALRQLGRIGIVRRHDETPDELHRRAGYDMPGLDRLTAAFQRYRYGDGEDLDTESMKVALAEFTAAIDTRLATHRSSPQPVG